MADDEDWHTSPEALAYLDKKHGRRYSRHYWYKLRHLGKGPQFYWRNGRIFYLPKDLDEWARKPETRGPFRKSCEARKSKKNDSGASIDCEVA